MKNFRDRYFEALGIKESNRKCARDLAHEIRQFEIDLYWKRASYFLGFQLIAFTALGFLLKDGVINSLWLLLVPASLGVITAFAGYLTARGSRFWQNNWEAHVDLLELFEDKTEDRKEEGRLTQVVICCGPPQFSVSRINELLLLLLTIGWTVALIIVAIIVVIPNVAEILGSCASLYRGIAVFIAVGSVGMACRMLWCKRTDLTGNISFGDTEWTKYSSRHKGTVPLVPFILRRNPPSPEET